MTTTAAAPRATVARLTAVVVLGGFMAGLDTSLVNVGLTTIAKDLHTGLAAAQWVTSGYLLALAAALPACPWLQRRLGASRLWMISLVTFTAASLLCAVAPNLALLLIARALQGISGGLLVPTGQNIIGRVVGSDRMGRVMSTAGLVIVLAPAIGPALGGVLIDTLSWRWLFVINLPIGIVAGILAFRILPRDTPDAAAKLDVVGLVLLSFGLPVVTLGLTRLGSSSEQHASGVILTVLGAALLTAFVVDACRRAPGTKRATLLNVGLFRQAPYATAQVTVFFIGVSQFGGLILLPLYFEALRGLTVVHTGLLLLAYGLGAMAALPVGGRIADRIGGGITCIVGLTITILARAPFIYLSAHANLVTVEVLQALRGIGVGLSGIPGMSAAMRAAPRHLADATTTANILQRVGGSLGSALIVLVISRTTPQLAAIQTAHAILVATAAAALIAAVTLAISEHRRTPIAASL